MKQVKIFGLAVVFAVVPSVSGRGSSPPAPCVRNGPVPCTMTMEVVDSSIQAHFAGVSDAALVTHVVRHDPQESVEMTLICSPQDRKHCAPLVGGETRAFVLCSEKNRTYLKTSKDDGRELHFAVYQVTRKPTDEAVAWQKALATMTHPPDTDLSHFPLRVTILETQWQQHAGGGFTGEGRGNVHNGDSLMAFTFTAPCAEALSVSMPGKAYPGKWVVESQRLLLLVSHRTGEASEQHQCELETKVLPNNVFWRNNTSAVIEVLTQDEFKARREKQKAAQAAQQQPAQAEVKTQMPPAGSTTQKVSITSNPDEADIEVDGAFVGSTPSVIELGTGEHSVVIRKLGYAPWERKLKLGGGDVKLSADLEKAPSAR